MTLLFAIGIAAVLAGLTLMQTTYVLRVARSLLPFLVDRSARESDNTEFDTASQSPFPEVALILCLRGADPSLLDCLAGISLQEYPHFQLHLMVDDIHDPALGIVEEFFLNETIPPIHVISEIPGTCSLKCAALVEAVRVVPEAVEVFAFIDADAVPDQNWLLDLVSPLNDPRVGATTGIRWFGPTQPTIGAYVRQIWNAAAIVQMDIYNIAWGGSLAIKRSTIMQADLLSKWSHAFCEDTMLSSVLKVHKLKLVRVRNLVLENTESTSLASAYRWIIRQLVTVRLYHNRWPLVYLHAWTALVGGLVAPLAVIAFWILNDGKPFYFTLLAFGMYQTWNIVLLTLIEWMYLRVIDRRESFNPHERTPIDVPRKFLAIVLVQFLHPLACWTTGGKRLIRWRGIAYEIGRRRLITMREYIPYREIERPNPSSKAIVTKKSIG